jgi:chromosome segregation ATPase
LPRQEARHNSRGEELVRQALLEGPDCEECDGRGLLEAALRGKPRYMDATLVALIPAVCGGIAALLFYLRLRAESTRAAGLAAEVESRRKDLEAARVELAQRAANAQHRGSEVGELRRKLEKTKRRAAREREERGGDPDRIRELEEILQGEKTAAAAMRAELSRVRAESAAIRVAVTPEPPASPAPAAADRERIEELERKLETAEKALEERDQKLSVAAAAAKKETSRLRGKLQTQESVYTQLRGELEAKKDRLKTQREELERLRAYRVALIDVVQEPPPEAVTASEPQPAAEPEIASEADTSNGESPAVEAAGGASLPTTEPEDTPVLA